MATHSFPVVLARPRQPVPYFSPWSLISFRLEFRQGGADGVELCPRVLVDVVLVGEHLLHVVV